MNHLRLCSTVVGLLFALAVAAPGQEDDGLPLPAPAHGLAPRAPSGPAVEVVRRFYQAFARSDFGTLEALYAPDVSWQDTIFSAEGREALMGIWRFELDPAAGGRITWEVLAASPPDERGNTAVQVRWRDVYRLLGQRIDNTIDATLVVDRGGRIVEHRESYSWSVWARQAFPWLGDLVDAPPVRAALKAALRRVVALKVALQRVQRRPSAPNTGFTDRLGR